MVFSVRMWVLGACLCPGDLQDPLRGFDQDLVEVGTRRRVVSPASQSESDMMELLRP